MREREQENIILTELENLRTWLHQTVDERMDKMFLNLLCGESAVQQDAAEEIYPLARDPAIFKGTKPTAVILPNHNVVQTATWREVAAALLRDCNGDPLRHDRLMTLRDRVAGNTRLLIASSPEEMRVPLQIDESLYVECKFDTEALLRNIRDKLLKPTGYEYQRVVLQCRSLHQDLQSATELPTETAPEPEHGLGMEMQMY